MYVDYKFDIKYQLTSPIIKLWSIYSRTRSHLVTECRILVVTIFGLGVLDQAHVQKTINYLLEDDRFLCPQEQRDVCLYLMNLILQSNADSLQPPRGYFTGFEIPNLIFLIYFSTPRRRGVQDDSFFERINPTFIFLIVTCIRHALKQWRTGEYVPPNKHEEFKWESAHSMFSSFQLYSSDILLTRS